MEQSTKDATLMDVQIPNVAKKGFTGVFIKHGATIIKEKDSSDVVQLQPGDVPDGCTQG